MKIARMTYPIQIINGGQYGSEAKGAIAAYLVERDHIDYAVRTGATNAGHTCTYIDAERRTQQRIAMQQLPVGWVRPETQLILGAGALIDLDILDREADLVSGLTGTDVRSRLTIDRRAYIHRSVHHDRARGADRHHLMGATGKGCSEALLDRVRLRGLEDWTIGNQAARGDRAIRARLADYNIGDTECVLNDVWDGGARIQLEGTQGQLLDLYLGPYPYTTHKQTSPAQWMLEAGLSPALPTEIWSVIRTCPIRVAGNSGPLPDEMSWPMLARIINRRREFSGLPPLVAESAICQFEEAVRAEADGGGHRWVIPPGSDGLDQHAWTDRVYYRNALSDLNKAALTRLDDATRCELGKLFEMTTVTKKLRRIARLNPGELAKSARQMRPHFLAVTFLNYIFPERWSTQEPLTVEEQRYLGEIEAASGGAPVALINRGPDPAHIVQVER